MQRNFTNRQLSILNYAMSLVPDPSVIPMSDALVSPEEMAVLNQSLVPLSFDNTQALSEGWDMLTLAGQWVLRRIDNPAAMSPPLGYTNPKFADDAGAIGYVAYMARFGSQYHVNALNLIGRASDAA